MLVAGVLMFLVLASCGLWVAAIPFAAMLILIGELAGDVLQHAPPLLMAAFVVSVPLTALLAAIVVERLSEVQGSLRALRAAAVLSSMALLASQDGWLDYAQQLQWASAQKSTVAVGAVLVALSNAVIFSALLSALALVATQLLVQAAVQFGFRAAQLQAAVPWGAVRLMGALLLITFFSQHFAAFVAHQLNPRHVMEQASK